jgi:hypothetical protein
MKTRIEDIVLIICGVCCIAITIAYIIFGINYLKQPSYDIHDVNQDGVVNMKDTVAVQKYIVENELDNAPEGGFITVTGVRTK